MDFAVASSKNSEFFNFNTTIPKFPKSFNLNWYIFNNMHKKFKNTEF